MKKSLVVIILTSIAFVLYERVCDQCEEKL